MADGWEVTAQPPVSLDEPRTSRPALPRTTRDARDALKDALPHLAVGIALGWWALPLTRAGGGTDAWSIASALLACMPLLVVARAWELRGPYLLAALAPGVAALLLNAVSRTGWSGLGDAATWLYAGFIGIGVLAYAVTPGRRLLVVALIGVAGIDQFGQGWLAWWGQGDIHATISGTFGWHNQFGAFVAAGLILGWALVIRGTSVGGEGSLGRSASLAAILLFPWLGAAVLLSGSRATIGLVIAAVVAMAVCVVRTKGEALRLVGCVLSAPLAVWLLSTSWLMPHSTGVAATALSRDEAAGANFLIRFHYDWAGLLLATKHPISGAGFDSYGPSGAQYMPADVAASDFVHNGWLQAFVDGGLLWLVPVLVATAWPALRAARRVLTGRRLGANAVQIGVSLSLLVLLGHALFDTDWRYPSLLALFAILAALLPWRARRVRRAPRAQVLMAVALVLGLLAGFGATAVGNSQNYPSATPPRWLQGVDQLTGFSDLARKLPTVPSDVAALRGAADMSSSEFDALMDRTAAPAEDDPGLAQLRALALAQRGDLAAARSLSTQSLPLLPRPPVVLFRAEVLLATEGVGPARVWVQVQLDRMRALQGSVPLAELEEWLARHPSQVTGSDSGGSADSSVGGGVTT